MSVNSLETMRFRNFLLSGQVAQDIFLSLSTIIEYFGTLLCVFLTVFNIFIFRVYDRKGWDEILALVFGVLANT